MSADLILVTATQDGYFGSYRKAGDVFEVTEDGFSSVWMSKGPVAKPGRDPLEELARAAREEALAAGGANAALQAALADVKDAAEREKQLTIKVAELEAIILDRDAQIVELKGLVPEGDPTKTEEKPPEEAAPVTRVRRTVAE
jgi:hypothetical protein